MSKNNVKTSTNFKKSTTLAILSIMLFITVYLLLVAAALSLTIFAGAAGIAIVALHPGLITGIVGLGVVSIGILQLVFLTKFLFKKHVVEKSHLMEITSQQEPELFKFIYEIADGVNTQKPYKVFLSADVNASVFYNSSFWSMFFPIKKNLQIGIGLINTMTNSELKAILAHEFGHFSQHTMKLGSFVYNVNKIIFNMLYDNDSFKAGAESWANASRYFGIFVIAALKIVEGIQWVLRKVYVIVNLSYLRLSREMEFHADAISAHTTGSQSLINALLRLDLSEHSFNHVMNYYNNKIAESQKTIDIYQQQRFVMKFMADVHELPLENHLPQVSLEQLNRFNRSKLHIENQWSSHPSVTERVSELQHLNVPPKENNSNLAMYIFSDFDELCRKTTSHLFDSIQYEKQATNIETESFIEEYTNGFNNESFSKYFNGYYDFKNPLTNDDGQNELPKQINADQFYDKNSVGLVYEANALENDIQTIKEIGNQTIKIKKFEYNGHQYSYKDSYNLAGHLEKELAGIRSKIYSIDRAIFHHFNGLAMAQHKSAELNQLLQNLAEIDAFYEKSKDDYLNIINSKQFMYTKLPFVEIELQMESYKRVEDVFKCLVAELLSISLFEKSLNGETNDILEKYLTKDWVYFDRPIYNDDALETLNSALEVFQRRVSQTYFIIKKELLNYYEELSLVQSKQFNQQ